MADKLIRIERHFELTKDDSDSGEFEGYASVFDTADSYGEFIAKGAFKKGLQKLAKEKLNMRTVSPAITEYVTARPATASAAQGGRP